MSLAQALPGVDEAAAAVTSAEPTQGRNHPTCVACGHDEMAPHLPGLLRCAGCGHVAADWNLSSEELRALYSRSYFFGDEYCDYVSDRAVLMRNFRRRLRVLDRFRDSRRHRKLFELGSAYGFFLDAARERFPEVEGIDIAEDGVEYARTALRVNILHGDLLETDLGSRRFDVACLWDTIEHLKHPDRYLGALASRMESGSLLAITTGDINSLVARVRKERWRLIHPPTHLHYFTARSLPILLDRYGFDVIYSRHCGFHRSLHNIAHNILVIRRNRPDHYERFCRTPFARASLYLNLYDILYCIGRKR